MIQWADNIYDAWSLTHCSMQIPISTTVRKCASNFKRTHQDTWHEDSKRFDDHQLVALSTLLTGSSYCMAETTLQIFADHNLQMHEVSTCCFACNLMRILTTQNQMAPYGILLPYFSEKSTGREGDESGAQSDYEICKLHTIISAFIRVNGVCDSGETKNSVTADFE